MYKNRVSVSEWPPIGCECFRANLNMFTPHYFGLQLVVGYSYNKLFNQNHDGLASENLTHMIVIGDYHRTLVEHPKKDERNNPSLGSFVFGCYLVAHPT